MMNPGAYITRSDVLRLSGVTVDRLKSLGRRGQLPFHVASDDETLISDPDPAERRRYAYTIERAALLAVMRVAMDGFGASVEVAQSIAANLPGDFVVFCAKHHIAHGDEWMSMAVYAIDDLWVVQRAIDDDDCPLVGRVVGPLKDAIAAGSEVGGAAAASMLAINVSSVAREVARRATQFLSCFS